VPIGEWVLRTACKQAKAWLDQGLQFQRIAVNVSVKQILHPNFLEMVEKVLTETTLEPQRLEIEITESLFMEDKHRVAAILRKLKEINIQIAIDDFGLGYSSLSYLKELPIDHLKIDTYFVTGIDNDMKNQSIICAIIAMAENMNLKVIAEGVETTGQVDFLSGKKCQEAQGYLFSRPLSTYQAEAYLRQAHPPAVHLNNS
jgi:diguanylate cyclase